VAGRHKRRKRSVDIESMTTDQLKRLEEDMGKQLAKIFDNANVEANKLLNVYGLETKIAYEISKKSEKSTKNKEVRKL